MANFFDGIWKALTHPVDEAEFIVKKSAGVTKDILHGDFSKAWKDTKAVPGDHQEMMNDITVPILGNNKLSKNSDAVAGAIIGGILAAPVIAGAGGAAGGASAGAAGGAAGTASGASAGGLAGAGTASGASAGGISSIGTQGVTQATSATTSTGWFDTIMDGFDMLSSAGGDDSPENKAPQSEFSKGFSHMLEVQRELASTPPAKRNELLAKKNSEALAKIFKPMFGEDK